MDILIALLLPLLTMAVFLVLLCYVVRAAVKEGMQLALRKDLLDQRHRDGTGAS